MTHIEQYSTFTSLHVRDSDNIHEWKFQILGEKLCHEKKAFYSEPSSLFENNSRSSTDSSDSGYLSSSPQIIKKSKKDKKDAFISETHSLDRGKRKGSGRVFLHPEPQGVDTRGGLLLLEEVEHFISLLSSLETEQLENEERFDKMPEISQPINLPQTLNDWMDEHGQCRLDVNGQEVKIEEMLPAESSTSLINLEETEAQDEEEVIPECMPIIPLFVKQHSPVRYFQETVHHDHPYKAVWFELEQIDERKTEAVSGEEIVAHSKEDESQSKAHEPYSNKHTPLRRSKALCPSREEIVAYIKEKELQNKADVPHSKADIEPQTKCKTEADSQTKRSAAPSISVQVDSQSKDISKERVLRSVGKGEEAGLGKGEGVSKGDGVSWLCEHLKESLPKLRRKKDPLFGKKRLRHLFRGQFKKSASGDFFHILCNIFLVWLPSTFFYRSIYVCYKVLSLSVFIELSHYPSIIMSVYSSVCSQIYSLTLPLIWIHFHLFIPVLNISTHSIYTDLFVYISIFILPFICVLKYLHFLYVSFIHFHLFTSVVGG